MGGFPAAIAPATREDHELAERRRLMRRFVAMGCFAWTAFAVSDLFAALVVARGKHLLWLLGLRIAGTLVGLGCYLLVSPPDVSRRRLDVVEVALFTTGGLIV